MLGISIAALTYTGNLDGAATVLCSFPLLGMLDPMAGWIYRGRFVKNDWSHLVVGCAFGGVGWWILGREGRVGV